MAITLNDWQFELAGIAFGVGRSVAVSTFERGGWDIREQDAPAPAGDWRAFGRDRKTPGSLNFKMVVNLTEPTTALAALDQIESVWDAESVRLNPEAVLPLRYKLNGRTRRYYGRPRRFSATPDHLVTAGRVDIVADFALAEPWSYEDETEGVRLSVGQADTSGSGVAFPFAFPVLWGGTVGAPRTTNITIGGTRPTWLTIAVTGPIVDPYVTIAGRTYALHGVVGAGETVTIDSLPWHQGVWGEDDTPAGQVTLAAQSRLLDLRLPRGQHEVTFGGIDNTGSAYADITWRNAYTSI